METLTKSWQYLGQKYIGSSGGNLYVRIYAKYTEQDIQNNRTYVVYEARSYYDKASYIRDDQGSIGVSGTGADYQSAGCTRPTGVGESVSVSTEGWVYHNNDGTKSISVLLQLVFQTGVGVIQHMVVQTYLEYQEPAVLLAVVLILVIMPSSV